MHAAVVLLVAAAALQCSARPAAQHMTLTLQGATSPPAFCHGIDCPNFQVLNSTSAYETRLYNQTLWASTLVQDIEYNTAIQTGFERLFQYISGQNEQKEKIPMTAPVQVRIEPGQGPFCTSNFTISFFVPFAYQANPPKPSASNVYIRTEQREVVFVKTFGGYAQGQEIQKEASSLLDSLTADRISVSSSLYVYAGYDAPSTVFNRHNEIWFYAQ
eukprot:m.9333 g.9333  ORF g.9333 m.9333 type:complete len:216 (+) comp5477_c0_seq1:133-780(+)